MVVQDRFYPETNYDVELRGFCKEKEIGYQAYWILKKDPDVLDSGHQYEGLQVSYTYKRMLHYTAFRLL